MPSAIISKSHAKKCKRNKDKTKCIFSKENIVENNPATINEKRKILFKIATANIFKSKTIHVSTTFHNTEYTCVVVVVGKAQPWTMTGMSETSKLPEAICANTLPTSSNMKSAGIVEEESTLDVL